jgi:hypothetical protein
MKVKLLISSDFSTPLQYMEDVMCNKFCMRVAHYIYLRKTQPATIPGYDKIKSCLFLNLASYWPCTRTTSTIPLCVATILPHERPLASCSFLTWLTEAVRFSETSAHFCRTARCYIPQDITLNSAYR